MAPAADWIRSCGFLLVLVPKIPMLLEVQAKEQLLYVALYPAIHQFNVNSASHLRGGSHCCLWTLLLPLVVALG